MSGFEAVNFSRKWKIRRYTHFSRCETHNNQSQTNCWLFSVLNAFESSVQCLNNNDMSVCCFVCVFGLVWFGLFVNKRSKCRVWRMNTQSKKSLWLQKTMAWNLNVEFERVAHIQYDDNNTHYSYMDILFQMHIRIFFYQTYMLSEYISQICRSIFAKLLFWIFVFQHLFLFRSKFNIHFFLKPIET